MPTIIDWPGIEERLDQLGLVPLSSPELTTVFEQERVHDRAYLDSKVAFRGEAFADAVVFNDLSDEDEHGILDVLPRRKLRTNLPPQIALDEEHAWIRYRVDGELIAKGKGTLDDLKFSIDGRSGVTLLDYRRHERDELLAEAVASDLTSPRSVLRSRDVANLERGDALALSTRAVLKASVTISWADIYTNTLTRLTAMLGGRARAALRIDSRATITIPVSVEDGFLLTFSRTDDGEIRIAIRRESADRRGARVRISASVKLARRKELATAVIGLITAILGAPLARIEEILAKVTLDDLDDQEHELIDQLLEQLGLSDEMEDLEALRELVGTIEQRAIEALEEVLSHNVATSFEYEYSRIAEADDLLNVVVRSDGLDVAEYGRLIRKHHRSLIRADFPLSSTPSVTTRRAATTFSSTSIATVSSLLARTGLRSVSATGDSPPGRHEDSTSRRTRTSRTAD